MNLQGLRVDRAAFVAGQFAVVYAAFLRNLGINRMQVALSALREGVLYDLWGRFHNNDMRDVTVHVHAPLSRRTGAGRARCQAFPACRAAISGRDREPYGVAAGLGRRSAAIGIRRLAHSGSTERLPTGRQHRLCRVRRGRRALSLLALAHRRGLKSCRACWKTRKTLRLH